jgi:DNA-binding protein H-NS
MASDDCTENRATKLRRDSVKTAAIHAGREETVEANCEKQKLKSMSVDELWILYEEFRSILFAKLDARKASARTSLNSTQRAYGTPKRARRPYPKVHPKYSNPDRPSETWSGRGKQPHWVEEQLKSGKKVDDLLISRMH